MSLAYIESQKELRPQIGAVGIGLSFLAEATDSINTLSFPNTSLSSFSPSARYADESVWSKIGQPIKKRFLELLTKMGQHRVLTVSHHESPMRVLKGTLVFLGLSGRKGGRTQ